MPQQFRFGIRLILLPLTSPSSSPQFTTTTIPPSMFDPQVPDEPPPPSYEFSQETFDQKTQQGIQASLEPQDPLQDLWEEWDEAKFEANARASANTSSSSSSSASSIPPVTAHQYPKEKGPRPPSPPPPQQEEPAVRPLKIVKKSQTAAYKKAAEAHSYQSGGLSNGPASSNGGASLSRSFSVLDSGRRTPPPVFEAVGPNYDGPEYEQVVMSYVPGSSRPSSPESVLSTEPYRPPALPPQPQVANSRPNTNMGIPPQQQSPTQYQPGPRPTQTQYQPAPRPTQTQHQPAQRPIQTQPQRPQYQQQQSRRRVGFDPMSAYRSKPTFTPGLEPTPEKIDPSLFYKCVHPSCAHAASKSSVTHC